MNEVEWKRIANAPVGENVLIWIPPVMLSSARASIPGKMVVSRGRYIDARSGKVTSDLRENCRWTELPKPPEA